MQPRRMISNYTSYCLLRWENTNRYKLVARDKHDERQPAVLAKLIMKIITGSMAD
jgi:hypothetical protein